MNLPLVSIITPSFNRVAFIKDTIKSVSSQTYKNIEYIVIDGASTDGTLDILRKHAKARSLRFLSEPDKGMYDAINKGLYMAKGEILCYLNSDDRYFPWSVETAVRYLTNNSAVDIVYGDTLVLDLEKNRKTINILPTFTSLWLRCGGIIPQPTVFFRRKVYTEVGNFQREVKYLADCEYWLRADSMGMRIAKIHELLAIESNHPGTIRQSVSATVSAEKRQLVARYAPCFCTNHWARSLVNRLKYMEKEWFMARLALGNHLRRGSAIQQWPEFRAHYSIRINTQRYYLDKVLRTKSDIWQVDERHG
jgi:glycosyltransferase involved in cell wall biosynthesis